MYQKIHAWRCANQHPRKQPCTSHTCGRACVSVSVGVARGSVGQQGCDKWLLHTCMLTQSQLVLAWASAWSVPGNSMHKCCFLPASRTLDSCVVALLRDRWCCCPESALRRLQAVLLHPPTAGSRVLLVGWVTSQRRFACSRTCCHCAAGYLWLSASNTGSACVLAGWWAGLQQGIGTHSLALVLLAAKQSDLAHNRCAATCATASSVSVTGQR